LSHSFPATAAIVAVDGGSLALGGGLLAILRPALAILEPGGLLTLNAEDQALRDDLPRWCRMQGHEYINIQTTATGSDLHVIKRGLYPMLEGTRETGLRMISNEGRITTSEFLKVVPLPETADPSTGFAPRGALVEKGGPRYPFTLNDADRVAPPEIGKLYDQAVSSQWDATRDIPWSKLPTLPYALESAVGQIMTFLAENELSALYLPSKFISGIHPAYVETALVLASQLADEARHIDVFLKRARGGGAGAGISSVVTSQSLLSLIETNDFTEAVFLLSVLGEGTFLDLLKYIEVHAPDEVTRDIVQRVHSDEARHVFFGMAHLRHALTKDRGLYARLEQAVRRRAATLSELSGAPEPVQDALIVLAAGGTEPSQIRRGHDAYRELLHTMHINRVKRLEHAGFTPVEAQQLSDLHTPNFM
jgi:TusA-related sulfurtransferase